MQQSTMSGVTAVVLGLFVGYAGAWYLGLVEGNFALLLFLATVVTGVYWVAEKLVFLPQRKRALAEAEAIRSMMNAPKKVLVAKKPVVEKTETPDPKALKGTLHKPAAGSTAPGARPTGSATNKEGQKEVKSAKLSSSWADEQAKKKEIKTRGDTGAGTGRSTNWRAGPRGGTSPSRRGGWRRRRAGASPSAWSCRRRDGK